MLKPKIITESKYFSSLNIYSSFEYVYVLILLLILEKASRVADFLELGELMIDDALHREESCGGHFRLESKTEEGEALRNDEDYCHAAVWEFKGENKTPALHKEPMEFEYVPLTQRSYK